MRVEYSARAVADLRQIAAYYARSGDPAVAERIAARVQVTADRIAAFLLSGRPVAQRQGVRVVLLTAFRYKIFYRVKGDTIRIVHIRHTSRRSYK